MVVIYRQDLFSDDLNALFDEFLKKKFNSLASMNLYCNYLFLCWMQYLLVNHSDIDSFYLIYHVH